MRHLVSLLLVVSFALAGCSASNAPAINESTTIPQTSSTPEPSESSQPVNEPQSATIEEVWALIECAENDPLGSRGLIQPGDSEGGPLRTGMCSPFGDGELTFFYEFATAEEAQSFANGGGLERGPSDVVLIDRSVVILTSDASTAATLRDTL